MSLTSRLISFFTVHFASVFQSLLIWYCFSVTWDFFVHSCDFCDKILEFLKMERVTLLARPRSAILAIAELFFPSVNDLLLLSLIHYYY